MPDHSYATSADVARVREDLHRAINKIEERLAQGGEMFHALRTSVAVLESRMDTLTSLPKELSTVNTNMATLGTEISALLQRLDKDDKAEDNRSRWWMDVVTRIIIPFVMAVGGFMAAELHNAQQKNMQPVQVEAPSGKAAQ